MFSKQFISISISIYIFYSIKRELMFCPTFAVCLVVSFVSKRYYKFSFGADPVKVTDCKRPPIFSSPYDKTEHSTSVHVQIGSYVHANNGW